MKTEIRTFLIDTCFWVISISIIFFFFILLLYTHNNVDGALKESFALTISCFSALATLGAAIIAARLFQNWKTQHSFTEQIKILSEMLDTVNEVQDRLDEARNYRNLVHILMCTDYDEDLNGQYTDQLKKISLFSASLHKLQKLENQIYLMVNDKKECPVFRFPKDDEECPLRCLLHFADKLMIDNATLNEFLLFGHENGPLNSKNLDFEESTMRNVVLTVLSSGNMYLRIAYPSLWYLEESQVNVNLKRWLNGLDQKIIAYRDKLDTLD
ncbi:hypothetical protein ACRS5A_18720 [Acinetobacter baumannii]|uniref:hypothetical protein n=1 Tax=Acinetobacter baumannii TaxID=470 RepID=UPI0030C50874